MIRANDVLAILHSNAYEEALPELTNMRTMGSVPFGGRYRLIDFTLSNIVNAGISKVGVVTKSNYQSLMDHVGTGKPWDLSRKRSGLFLLPPFLNAHSGRFSNRIEALKGNMQFISRSSEEYVLLMDCNVVTNFSVNSLMNFHEENGADISIVYGKGKTPKLENIMTFEIGADKRIEKVSVGAQSDESKYSLNIMFMKKALLERLINEASALKKTCLESDIIAANADSLKICGMESENFAFSIDSLHSYYKANMMLLDGAVRNDLFDKARPVYTKMRDDMPALYGLDSTVQNSLVSDGCDIKGTVINSVLARGVKVEKGAIVKNAVIMQGSFIGSGAHIENVIFDKNVVIKPEKTLIGAEDYPVFVGKGIVI